MIDAVGFGVQAFSLTPQLTKVFEPWLPPAWRHEQAPLLAGMHPAFDGLRCARDAALIVASGVEPLAAIAMIDESGPEGLLGRGPYAAPAALFAVALDPLNALLNAGERC